MISESYDMRPNKKLAREDPNNILIGALCNN